MAKSYTRCVCICRWVLRSSQQTKKRRTHNTTTDKSAPAVEPTDTAAPASTIPPSISRAGARHRGPRRALLLVFVPLLVLGLLAWGVAHLARSEAGTRWLLEQVPGLNVT